MEDDGDADIYFGLGEYHSDSTLDAKDSHSASAAELDLLDSSVLPREVSPVKKVNRSQVRGRRGAGDAVERDSITDTLDLAQSSSASNNDSKAFRSPISAELHLDTSVLQRQANPVEMDHLPKAIARPRPARSLVDKSVKPSTSFASTDAQKTILTLKRENEMLRHNISILYKTAKHLVDSKEKEIVNLKRRLDNLVFKRNRGSQNSSHATASGGMQQQGNSPNILTARSTHDSPLQNPCRRNQALRNSPHDTTNTRDARHHYQERSESGDSPRTPSTQISRDSPFQEHSCHLQPAMPTKAKADMSEDLQRLYQYNSVKPENRTEFSQVPALALTPQKKGSASRVVVTPTKSAAQINARRLVKNSIKNVIGSPAKQPRWLEVYTKNGSSPLKRRRASERTAFSEKRGSAPHKERGGALTPEIPPERWAWEPRVRQPRTPPHSGSRVSERPRTPHQGWPEESINAYYVSPPLREKTVPKGSQAPPEYQTNTSNRGIYRTPPPKEKRIVKGPHTPPEEQSVQWALDKSETPSLEGKIVAELRQTKPEDQRTESPATQSKVTEIGGPSKNAVAPIRLAIGKSSPYREMAAGSGRPSLEVRPRERLGIKRRRSPSEPPGNKRAPENSSTVEKPLRECSPGRDLVVEKWRDRSPREFKDFRSLPAKRRRSRSRSLSASPPPRPRSPRQHSQVRRITVRDRIGVRPERHRIPSYRRHSPEDRNVRRRSRERYSPVPRRHHRSERPVRSPSPARLGRTSRRQSSPGRRPMSPLVRDNVAKVSPLNEHPTKRPEKRTSSLASSVVLVQAKEDTGVRQEPEVPRPPPEDAVPCPLESESLRTCSVDATEPKELADGTALCDSGGS
ncbi:uncharacterized protein [Dermacentor andersoni]|uniref:uncharacterized protein n=1 Tax=Dermacentor andersoni TaxID=34620 RepID=UPI0021554E99|nr:serine/arginine repetitive matrix protein 2-like [Dermacentor andersoni]